MERRIIRFNAGEMRASIAYDRQVYLMTEQAEKKEIEMIGKAKGFVKGAIKGRMNTILEMTSELYPDYDCLWIKDLHEFQLQHAQKLLLKQLSYNEFNQSLQQFKY